MSDLNTIKQYMERIAKYSENVKNLSRGANPMLAPMMLQDVLAGMDVINEAISKAIVAEMHATAELKKAEAEAYHDRAPAYLREKGIKETGDAKKYYVQMDDAVQAAMRRKAQAEAILVFLKNKLHEFRCAHDDIKKMAYSQDYTNK